MKGKSLSLHSSLLFNVSCYYNGSLCHSEEQWIEKNPNHSVTYFDYIYFAIKHKRYTLNKLLAAIAKNKTKKQKIKQNN